MRNFCTSVFSLGSHANDFIVYVKCSSYECLIRGLGGSDGTFIPDKYSILIPQGIEK